MRERTIKIVGLMLVIAMLASISTVTFAAKKTAKAKATGVKVPSSIINGSDITANRSFRNLNVKETTLAGITLGDSNKKVLQKYGNPTNVIVHSEPAPVNQGMGMGPGMGPGTGAPGVGTGMPGVGAPGMPGMPGAGTPGMGTGTGMPGMGTPGMTGGMGMGAGVGMPGGMGMQGGMGMTPTGMPSGMSSTMPNGMPSGMPSANPVQPGVPSAMPNGPQVQRGVATPTTPGAGVSGAAGVPGMAGMPGMPGMAGANATASVSNFLGTSERISSRSICWRYDLASGVQLEFIIKEGRVSQITVLSLYPWQYAKLKCGIMIGDTYKLVTYLWGVDYKQQAVGSFSRMEYFDKKGTALIFLNKKLVGITVAAGDPII
ncbi:MAG: hypothetical protein IJS60_02660 [Abditibacteriota bacterium]|nr:hypothetical protein [Abditibacteriota bacterium]